MSDASTNPTPLYCTLPEFYNLADLVEMFVSQLPNRVAAIEELLRANDVAGLTRLAHQLRGSAGGYGFPGITDAAAALDHSARAHADVETLAAKIRDLADLCARAVAQPPPNS